MKTRLRATIRRASTILFVAVVVVIICVIREDDFVAVIRNNSPYTMTSVEVNGDGAWTHQVADIPPGDKVSVLVNQAFSESGLGIRFMADGTEVAKGGVAYVMHGGRGTTATFTVLENLDVNTAYHRRPSWLLLP